MVGRKCLFQVSGKLDDTRLTASTLGRSIAQRTPALLSRTSTKVASSSTLGSHRVAPSPVLCHAHKSDPAKLRLQNSYSDTIPKAI
jgi:hypothetical protein